MSTEENKAIVRRLIEEVWDAQRFEVLEELMPPERAAGTRRLVTELRAALPDAHHTIEQQVAEGEWVVTRVTWRGTHRGELRGLPASGAAVTLPEAHFHRVVGGQIVEGSGFWDTLALVQQLGATLSPPLRGAP
jgi:steroid delta-isomerase-like uncharacterized protein